MLRGVFMGELVEQFRQQFNSMNDAVQVFDLYLTKIYEYYRIMNGVNYCDTKFLKICLDMWSQRHPPTTLGYWAQNLRLVKMTASAVGYSTLRMLSGTPSESGKMQERLAPSESLVPSERLMPPESLMPLQRLVVPGNLDSSERLVPPERVEPSDRLEPPKSEKPPSDDSLNQDKSNTSILGRTVKK